ncbi:hypothetical protein SESBI_30783 [Sesbania bispinosa]|nr:hypothetical protein SESBI_30783 [Sesbania bispinosa]
MFWWKPKETSLEGGLRPFRDDVTALELANFAITNKCELDVYVEDEMGISNSMPTNGSATMITVVGGGIVGGNNKGNAMNLKDRDVGSALSL